MIVVEASCHAFGIDDDRAAFDAVQILARAVPGTERRIKILWLLAAGADLTARIEVGAVRDGPVFLLNAEHIGLVIPTREIRERWIRRVARPDAVGVPGKCKGLLDAAPIAPI